MRWPWSRDASSGEEQDVAVLLPEPLASEVTDLLGRGERIEAVKLVRRRTGLTILPAVRAVDAIGGSGIG